MNKIIIESDTRDGIATNNFYCILVIVLIVIGILIFCYVHPEWLMVTLVIIDALAVCGVGISMDKEWYDYNESYWRR